MTAAILLVNSNYRTPLTANAYSRNLPRGPSAILQFELCFNLKKYFLSIFFLDSSAALHISQWSWSRGKVLVASSYMKGAMLAFSGVGLVTGVVMRISLTVESYYQKLKLIFSQLTRDRQISICEIKSVNQLLSNGTIVKLSFDHRLQCWSVYSDGGEIPTVRTQ